MSHRLPFICSESGLLRLQVSLMHPAAMFGMLGVSIYTGILGWNYRQARLIPVRSPLACRQHAVCVPTIIAMPWQRGCHYHALANMALPCLSKGDTYSKLLGNI